MSSDGKPSLGPNGQDAFFSCTLKCQRGIVPFELFALGRHLASVFFVGWNFGVVVVVAAAVAVRIGGCDAADAQIGFLVKYILKIMYTANNAYSLYQNCEGENTKFYVALMKKICNIYLSVERVYDDVESGIVPLHLLFLVCLVLFPDSLVRPVIATQ